MVADLIHIPYKWSVSLTNNQNVRGPITVEYNLVAGLSRIGTEFRLNPNPSEVTKRVGVLRHVGALHWAIRAKREGRVGYLAAGPNLVVTPSEAEEILLSPYIDLVITPSPWVSDLYLAQAPDLAGRIAEWAVGVDTNFWKPNNETLPESFNGHWLVYDKSHSGIDSQILVGVIKEITRRGHTHEILNYGDYSQVEYREALRRSGAMAFLSPSESQGIAQFEAWACNVPTLVWDRRRWEYKGQEFEGHTVSSAPYLTAECGERFFDISGLESSMDSFLERYAEYSPRVFILQNFTLEKSAQKYVDLIFSGTSISPR
jgi:hypothetical protein